MKRNYNLGPGLKRYADKKAEEETFFRIPQLGVSGRHFQPGLSS